MNQHTRNYLNGPTYARRQRIRNSRNAQVAKISSLLVPIRTHKEVAEILGCSTQNVWAAEKIALWKLITRIKAMNLK